MSESSSGQREPNRSLGLLDATMIGMGAMIGAGIFVLTGLAAETAGPAAILAFALNGVVTSFTALSYAELASSIPKNGGGYAYVNEVFSDVVSFLMGWMLWFAYMIAGALYALGFGSNFIEFFHIYDITLPGGHTLYALGVVAVFVALNAVSASASGGAETVVTVIKIIILIVFSAFGASAASAGEFTPFFTQGEAAILSAMGLTFIAFEGYDLIATVTEEVKNPRKNIPRAIFISLGATLVIYLVVVFVAIGTLGAERLGAQGETGIAVAAGSFMPEFPLIGGGDSVIAFGAVFSTISALNAVILASSRVAFSMGREGQLVKKVGQLHHRYGTPFWAIVASSAVMLLSVMYIPIQQVGNLSSLFFLVSFVLVNASVIRLRRERPDMSRPYEIPFYPVPPILGIVLNLVLGFFIDPVTWMLGTAWLLFGVLVYWLLQTPRVTVDRLKEGVNR